MTADYLRDPAAIYERSFELVREASDLSRFPEDMHGFCLRLVHACGRPEVLRKLAWSEGAATAGRSALSKGSTILVDARMVADGVIRDRLPEGAHVMCTLGLGSVPGIAARLGATRSAAAVELWRPWLEGAVVAIGNAPTALFHLLERLQEGWPRPALILGFPVGFVGAAESKRALADSGLDVPWITLHGRDGGSALAAAAVNALAWEKTP